MLEVLHVICQPPCKSVRKQNMHRLADIPYFQAWNNIAVDDFNVSHVICAVHTV